MTTDFERWLTRMRAHRRPNPYIAAWDAAHQVAEKFAPLYGTVVAINADSTLDVSPLSNPEVYPGCRASGHVLSSVSVGDTVLIVPVEGGFFVTATVVAPSSGATASVAEPSWIGADAFTLSLATPDLAGRGSGLRMAGWALTGGAADEAITTTTWVPEAAKLWTPTIYLAPSDTGSGNVRLDLSAARVPAGEQIDQAAEVTITGTAATPGVASRMFTMTFAQQSLDLSGAPVRFGIRRNGFSDALDTYASDVWVIGLGIAWA